jgi:hypothetical protein
MTASLSDRMDFDHVIEVRADGSIIDRPDFYAPDALDPEPRATELGGWTLLNGYSGQDRYPGPWMHNSESIGGRLERDILATPGIYVAIYAQWTPEDDGDELDVEGWAIARRDA